MMESVPVVPANMTGRQLIEYVLAHPESDIQALQQRLLEIGTGSEAFLFAKLVPGADVEQLEKRVLEVGDGYDAFLFADEINGADVPRLQQRVLEIGTGWDLYSFANEVSGADVEALQKRLLEVGTGDDAWRFAWKVQGADVEALQALVLERGESMSAYRFARDIPKANIPALFAYAKVKAKDDGPDFVERVEAVFRDTFTEAELTGVDAAHLATLQEMAKIIRGEHLGWRGDRIHNAETFLHHLQRERPEDGIALARAFRENPSAFSAATGLSPERVGWAASRLEERAQMPDLGAPASTDSIRPE